MKKPVAFLFLLVHLFPAFILARAPRTKTKPNIILTGKPDEMIATIAEGKIGAFFKEQTLTAQAFVKDSSKTVADYLKESGDVKVTEF